MEWYLRQSDEELTESHQDHLLVTAMRLPQQQEQQEQ